MMSHWSAESCSCNGLKDCHSLLTLSHNPPHFLEGILHILHILHMCLVSCANGLSWGNSKFGASKNEIFEENWDVHIFFLWYTQTHTQCHVCRQIFLWIGTLCTTETSNCYKLYTQMSTLATQDKVDSDFMQHFIKQLCSVILAWLYDITIEEKSP